MEVTAFLCDHAQVSSDNKLYVNGACITRIMTPDDGSGTFPINVHLAVLVNIPWQGTNQPHRLTIELVHDAPGGAQRVAVPFAAQPPNLADDDNGKLIADFNAGRGPDMVPGETTLMPLALPFVGFRVPAYGPYFFDIAIDGTSLARVPLHVRPINQSLFGIVANG